jgi:hypothetical protein
MKKIELFLPILTISEANNSDHWTKKRKRKIAQQTVIKAYMLNRYDYKLPCTVTLTRIGKRLLDFDNMVHSFKSIRDQIAEIIIEYQDEIKNSAPNISHKRAKGSHDSDPRIEWRYAQETGKNKGIKVEIET